MDTGQVAVLWRTPACYSGRNRGCGEHQDLTNNDINGQDHTLEHLTLDINDYGIAMVASL